MKWNHPAKRLTAALLTGAMVLSLCAPVLAEGTDAAPGEGAGTQQPAEETDIALDAAHFPDEKFCTYLKAFDKNGDDSLSQQEREAVTKIEVPNMGIKTLQGIEYFPKLGYLYCYKNEITELDVSKNTALTGLTCNYNQLTSLDVSSNTALTSLDCSDNQLATLELGSAPLVILTCQGNQLTRLDLRGNHALKMMDCSDNQLTTLELGDNPITDMYCSSNQLESLKISSTVLTNLGCSKNRLKSLDVSSTVMIHLDCDENQLTALDVRSNTALTSLDCDSNQLTALDVRSNTELEELHCEDNQLTALDVAPLTKLEKLYCGSNQLTALDVSQNKVLKLLYCNKNQLTALDVRSNTALNDLWCAQNRLTSLDLSQNTALLYLNLEANRYKVTTEDGTFDLSTLPDGFVQDKVTKWGPEERCTVEGTLLKVSGECDTVWYEYDTGHAWEKLEVYLDLTNNGLVVDDETFPDIQFLYYVMRFDTNGSLRLGKEELEAVTEIDVSGMDIRSLQGIEYFPNLQTLKCAKNQLTTLDVSKNLKLTTLDCSENQLTSLDLSQNTALTSLNCEGNRYSITPDENNRFDLSTLPAGFEADKAEFESCCTVEGDTLTVGYGISSTTYRYDAGYAEKPSFTLTFPAREDPDPSGHVWDIAGGSIELWVDENGNQMVRQGTTTRMDSSPVITGTASGSGITAGNAASTGTLRFTLRDFHGDRAITVGSNVELTLDGKNTVTTTENEAPLQSADGTQPVVTMQGSGSLALETGADGVPALDVYELVLEGGSITATATGADANAVQAENITVKGGSLAAEGNSTGIYAAGSITVADGSVTAEGGDLGICGRTGVQITGGEVDTNGIAGKGTTAISGAAKVTVAPVQAEAADPEAGTLWFIDLNTWTEGDPDTDDLVSGRVRCVDEKGSTVKVIVGPETPAEPEDPADTDTGSAGDGGAGALAAVALGGAAIWGGYEVATRVILHQLLPEGAAIPKTKAELATLLWNTAGQPEPANAPAFVDVDGTTAKAAQWCTEQGYLTDTFQPDKHVAKYNVIRAWKKAFPKAE